MSTDEPTREETEEDVCGYTFDHDLDLFWEEDGFRCLHCRNCGAEIVEEAADEH